MEKLTVLLPGEISDRLKMMLEYSLKSYIFEIIKTSDEIIDLKNKRILFAVELNQTGINIELFKMLEKIKLGGGNFLEGSVGSIVVNSSNEFFTRNIARMIILYANMAGCLFIGRPLLEATGSLKGFSSYTKKYDMNLYEACVNEFKKTVESLVDFKIKQFQKPKIIALHASNYKTSNTLALWQMVKENFKNQNVEIKEIHIENGSVKDCRGCVYKACKHFSKYTNCFYGGVMVEEVYPAIIESDILIMLCPNYNDSISANMSAVINRLTALFRKVKFYDKYLYSVIVSGHSGSDIIAEQLISALNINKTFMLPPKFALMETANDMGDIYKIENIELTAKNFAENIIKTVIDKR